MPGIAHRPARVGQATLGSAGLEVRRIASIARTDRGERFDDQILFRAYERAPHSLRKRWYLANRRAGAQRRSLAVVGRREVAVRQKTKR